MARIAAGIEDRAVIDPESFAAAHWQYVASILFAHGETYAVINKCGHHYRTAFVHGWKHALEDNPPINFLEQVGGTD